MTDLTDYYFRPETETINGKSVPPITDDFPTNHPSIVDRFFTRYYYRKPHLTDSSEDHIILFHTNRICLIGLSPEHIAHRTGIKSINFDIGNCDRSKNRVTGKGKKGAMHLQSTSTLAILTCMDGSEYKIVSCIQGKLIEVNERLLTDVSLLEREGDGYVGIVLPKLDQCDAIKSGLWTEEQYKKIRDEERG